MLVSPNKTELFVLKKIFWLSECKIKHKPKNMSEALLVWHIVLPEDSVYSINPHRAAPTESLVVKRWPLVHPDWFAGQFRGCCRHSRELLCGLNRCPCKTLCWWLDRPRCRLVPILLENITNTQSKLANDAEQSQMVVIGKDAFLRIAKYSRILSCN